MNTELKSQLSTNYSHFEELVSAGKIYVDKTRHIHRMLKQGKNYFLARPRRFGKSLLVSTLQALFEGKKEVFAKTWIAQSDYEWPTYPVMRLDMSEISTKTLEVFSSSLLVRLQSLAQDFGVSLNSHVQEPSDYLSLLIKDVCQKHNKQLVVLIDEYDAPVLRNLEQAEQAEQFRDVLKDFYTVLKSQNQHIRFLLITGISKFSRMSIFSGLNNLNDVSQASDYEDLLGYTQEELQSCFSAHIDQLTEQQGETREAILDKIREWYNGYRFAARDVTLYNPVSVMKLFESQEFKSWWFETGTPGFLIKLLKKDTRWKTQDFEQQEVGSAALQTFDLQHLDLQSILLQTGYLTIKNYSPDLGGIYTVGYPNKEVRESFLRTLMEGLSYLSFSENVSIIFAMVRALLAEDVNAYISKLQEFFKRVPYEAHLEQERDFQNMIYAVQTLLGMNTGMEVHTNKGRIDMAVEAQDCIYLFEYKRNESAQAAMDQIEAKKYYEAYEHKGKKIMMIGLNFSTTECNINESLVREWKRK